MIKKTIIALFVVTWIAHAAESEPDFARAEALRTLTNNKVTHNRVEPHWMLNGKQFWYQSKTGADTYEFIFVDAVKGERIKAFDQTKLAKALETAKIKGQNPERLALEIIAYSPGKSFDFRCGKALSCDLNTYEITELKNVSGALSPAPSPDTNGRMASKPGGVQTTVTFTNSKEEVELFWIDMNGKRKSYGKLAAGRELEMETYSGHVWIAVAKDGRTVGSCIATDAPTVCDLQRQNPSAPASEKKERGREPRQVPGPREESPDGKWIVQQKNFNLVLRNKETKQETALTQDGTDKEYYSGGVYWSPDSKHFAAYRVKNGDERKVTYVESSPKDQLQPKVKVIDYLKPGDNVEVRRPCLFDVATTKKVPVEEALFQNPWSISDLRWMPDSSRFTFLFNARGHQALRLVSVDAATGAARAIINEESKTFIDYSGKMFLRYLDATNEIIWMSERDGWNHLYLIDANSGAVKSQITKGEWVVRGVEKVDYEKREIWFRAGGIRTGQDPYLIHFARVNFDGSGLTILTEGNGTHGITYSPDGSTFIDTYSRVDTPPVFELRRTSDGKLLCELERSDMSALLKAGWRAPEPFVAKGRDGTTDIYGVIVRPTSFDPNKKYPVIEHIYAGPQGAFVPKSFSSFSEMMKLSELGFILVQIDGMGTSYRSKKFHDVCWKNLGDSGFPDRILWMKAAAQKYPYMDLSRVGIYGGSAGGQSALRALLAFGDFYKAAVADSGCHDNRMDKIWWNEQWMGWPIGPHYAEQSNVTQAHKLTGKLLLLAGEMDTNVDPSSTMQVANALIKAGKDFEILVVPGAGHGVAGIPFCWKKLERFFYKNLNAGEERK